ncbi:hypothetical protein K290105B7_31060 [Anaerostipes caccae]|uniref:Uncharacterized protein n=1 Tax=Anaerostipes caccae (strain DSM 14662 / CCUG 47493 / JCM 13470 / NCIMB 13811 / L1-92) TaxID=411490 RepID=B0MCT9_ANACD|nr:hypothetical protein ANACAC_01381 [Anaerostipes caccae L1-92]RGH23933.1 hypothetical protein DWV34_07805 [Anaerostipes sp. AF04-45]BCD35838.1 hypothetical protein ANCC_18740 [Anaerostipes caccae L1-92]
MIVIICILEEIINHLWPMTDVNEPITETDQYILSVIDMIMKIRYEISSRGLLLDKNFYS